MVEHRVCTLQVLNMTTSEIVLLVLVPLLYSVVKTGVLKVVSDTLFCQMFNCHICIFFSLGLIRLQGLY